MQEAVGIESIVCRNEVPNDDGKRRKERASCGERRWMFIPVESSGGNHVKNGNHVDRGATLGQPILS